jgi:hypothetical protein
LSKTRNSLSAFFPAERNILENPGRFLMSVPVPASVSAFARRSSEVLPVNRPEATATNRVSVRPATVNGRNKILSPAVLFS